MLRTTSRRASLAAHLLEASTCIHRLEVDVELVGQGLVHGGGGPLLLIAAAAAAAQAQGGRRGRRAATAAGGGGGDAHQCDRLGRLPRSSCSRDIGLEGASGGGQRQGFLF